MARKYEIRPNCFAWNFERCEELVLIAGYEDIRPDIPPGSSWAAEFEGHFFQHGNGIAFSYIDEINAVRRRKTLPKLDFIETDVLDYGRSANKMMKSEHRQRMRDEYIASSTDARLRLLSHAYHEMKSLLPPHIPYEQYAAHKRRLTEEAGRSREEVARRVQALKAQEPPPAQPQAPARLDPEKAVKMLRSTKNANLHTQIIGRLSSDDALSIIDQIEDDGVRDALICHSLELESPGSQATQ